jgi:hypothetical protein
MIDHEKKKINLDYNYQITTEMILMLMQGKKINFQLGENSPRFTFYPPQRGFFITERQYYSLKSSCTHGQEPIFYEIEND